MNLPCDWRVLCTAQHWAQKCPFFSRYTSPDFLYVRSWLPCIFFAGGITMGNIGRQLAMVSLEEGGWLLSSKSLNVQIHFFLHVYQPSVWLKGVQWGRNQQSLLVDVLSELIILKIRADPCFALYTLLLLPGPWASKSSYVWGEIRMSPKYELLRGQ